MNANEETRRAENDSHVSPARAVTPKAYRLGASSQDFLHSVSYSGLAWFALGVAQLVSGLGCLAIPLAALYGVFSGIVLDDIALILYSVIGTPVAFVLQFAIFVVFTRVAELKRR